MSQNDKHQTNMINDNNSQEFLNNPTQLIDCLKQQQAINNPNTSLIQSLRQQPNYLIQKYNIQKTKIQPTRAGGVYIPPHRLKILQQQILEQGQQNNQQYQRMMWQLLRKSINGIVNKVNITNIQNIIIQLLNQNILRGKGLLTRAIIKAQMASPNFTHVYAALIAVINTKLPEIGDLIIRRVIIQFRRAYERNNRIVCTATTKMIAHLINQRVLGQICGLQLLQLLLFKLTQDSIEIACDFMIEVGQVLTEIIPAGVNAIFQRFKTLLHQGEIGQKAQYSIQKLFAIRKTNFKQHEGVIIELDLIEIDDQIIHNISLDDQCLGNELLNIFHYDQNYQKTEQDWQIIKKQIIGEQNILELKYMPQYKIQQDKQQQQQSNIIYDLTQQDLINLRKTIYLIIQSTANYQQCTHKIIKMKIIKKYQNQLIDMIIQCCLIQRIYQKFFGLLSERFCNIDDTYKELFIKAFINYYNTIFKLEVNKIRNLSLLFSHLFYTHSIDWKVLQIIQLSPQTTTAAGRMFIKILFKDIAQNMGIDRMLQVFNQEGNQQYFSGLFPIDDPTQLRFAINFYTSIQLGKLTDKMREILALQEQIIRKRTNKIQQQKALQILKEEQQMLKLLQEENKLRNQQQEQKMQIQYKRWQKQKQNKKQQNNKKQRKYEKNRKQYLNKQQYWQRQQKYKRKERKYHKQQQYSNNNNKRYKNENRLQKNRKIKNKYKYKKNKNKNKKKRISSSISSLSSQSSYLEKKKYYKKQSYIKNKNKFHSSSKSISSKNLDSEIQTPQHKIKLNQVQKNLTEKLKQKKQQHHSEKSISSDVDLNSSEYSSQVQSESRSRSKYSRRNNKSSSSSSSSSQGYNNQYHRNRDKHYHHHK